MTAFYFKHCILFAYGSTICVLIIKGDIVIKGSIFRDRIKHILECFCSDFVNYIYINLLFHHLLKVYYITVSIRISLVCVADKWQWQLLGQYHLS